MADGANLLEAYAQPPRRQRSYGKGSVQDIPPPALGQVNLLDRIARSFGQPSLDMIRDVRSEIERTGRLPEWGFGNALAALGTMPIGPFGTARGPRVQFTPEMRETALRAYEDGQSLRAVSDIIGVDVATLRNHFAAEGVPVRPRGIAPIDLPAEQMRRLREHHDVTAASLAERHGVSRPTIWRRLRNDPSPPAAAPSTPAHLAGRAQERSTDMLAQVEALRREGASYTDIARQLGVTRNQVAGVVRDLRASGRFVPGIAAPVVGGAAATTLSGREQEY